MVMQMNYKYVVDHISKETAFNRRPGLRLIPEYITIHSTGNPGSTARNERGWLTNPLNDRTASWHLCIDEREVVEAIPLDEVAWHAGDGSGGPGNRKSLALEICESGSRAQTLENAAGLTALLLQERGWGIDRLRRHYDWSGKACPRLLMADNWAPWENFKCEVQKFLSKLAGENSPGEVSAPKSPASIPGSTGSAASKPPVSNAGETAAAAPKPPASIPGETAIPKPPAAGGPGPGEIAVPGQPADGLHALPQIQRRVAGTLNGRPTEFEAYLINNTVHVPLRPLTTVLGLQLDWKDDKYHIFTTAAAVKPAPE